MIFLICILSLTMFWVYYWKEVDNAINKIGDIGEEKRLIISPIKFSISVIGVILTLVFFTYSISKLLK